MKLLEGKTCLVTGASRGIGKQIALTLASNGADVAFSYRSSTEMAELLVKEINAMGVKGIGLKVDASELEATQGMMNEIIAEFGKIDVIINNAGITQDNLILRMSEDQWNKVIDTNLKSVFNTTKASMKQMFRQRSGVYINISSVVGLTGNAGQANYAASKAGMIGFTKSVAKEAAPRGIRANVIAPGFITTEMTDKIPEAELEKWVQNIPLKRAGSPEDVANMCVFLASDLSSYVTGQVINVDGGMVM